MKVLFIPYPTGPVSHGIPLISLMKKLETSWAETAFLLTALFHTGAKKLGLNVLDIDHKPFEREFMTEMSAYNSFQPDVVVDDHSPTTFFASRYAGIPRAAVQRTGMFPGEIPGNKNHIHSSRLDINHYKSFQSIGLAVPETMNQLYQGDMQVVPGIKTIEKLPPHLEDDPTYVFSGSLIVEDQIQEMINRLAQNTKLGKTYKSISEIEAFFDLNKTRNRTIVYFTFGLVAVPTPPIIEAIRYLLDSGIAVITSINIGKVKKEQQELYFQASFLPMHLVCSRSDLMIHHCGSGTYQYPIIHQLPAITIGTGCYDRDHVARRLEELGISPYIPAPNECDHFDRRFKKTFEDFIDPSGSAYQAAKQQLAKITAENQQTIRDFNFQNVLLEAVERHKNTSRPGTHG